METTSPPIRASKLSRERADNTVAAPPRRRADPLSVFVRLAPGLTLLVLIGPLVFGLAFTLAPAFGYLPAIGGETVGLDAFRALGEQPGIGRSALLSLVAALVTTLLSLGLVALFLGASIGTRLLRRMQGLISPLLAVPHAAAAFGLAFLIAPSGVLARFVSPTLTGWDRPPDLLVVNDPMGLAMIAGLVVKEVPFLLLVALAALPQGRVVETRVLALSLGYGRVMGFLVLSWPRLYRQIRLAVFAVIAYSSSVVDVAVILGPQLPPTLAVRLVEWMRDPDLSMRFLAAAGAVLQLGVTVFALLAWLALERVGGLVLFRLTERGTRGRAGDETLRWGATGLLGLVSLLTFAGLAVLALWSVSGPWRFPDTWPQALSTRTWERAWTRAFDPLIVTVIVGGLATLIATVLALGCLERERRVAGPDASRASRFAQRALPLLYLPLLVPQIAFLLGLQIMAVSLHADGTLLALVVVHLVFVLPYVFLSVSDPWRAMDGRYDQVAASLGASRGRVLWRVRLPMLARAIGIAAAVGFAASIGQYLPTVLVGAGRLTTITTEAVQLASGGNRRTVAAYAFLQAVLPFVGFVIAALVPALLFGRRRGLRS